MLSQASSILLTSPKRQDFKNLRKKKTQPFLLELLLMNQQEGVAASNRVNTNKHINTCANDS